MGIIGKVVGGTIGFAIGGPLGAIAGAVFGHAFDSNELALDSESQNALSSLEESQLAFFVGTFSMLSKLAKADGQVTREEIATIESFADRELGLSHPSRQVALNIFNAALNSPASFEEFAEQFYQRFRGQPQLIETMVDILLRVSVSDGSLNSSEESLILSAVRIFEMSQDRYSRLKSHYSTSTDRAYDILGCRSEDSMDEIKKQYRHLVRRYHPDTIAGMGLPDEFTQLAGQKFREIQSAYDEIKKQCSFN